MITYRSESYNFDFNEDTGFFQRWGETKADDPQCAPGPETLDIEIDTRCSGGCQHCYKGNTARGEAIGLHVIASILDEQVPTLTQIAYGVGDFPTQHSRSIFKMTKASGIAPNVTIRPQRDQDFQALIDSGVKAIAVSRYDPAETYDVVRRLLGKVQQVTIHQVLAEETIPQCVQTVLDVANPKNGLQGLHAVTLLLLKPKGRAKGAMHAPPKKAFRFLLEMARKLNVRLGFDSCSAPYVADAAKELGWDIAESIEPCESGLFSLYIDVKGEAYPCSFAPGEPGWETGIPVTSIADVWRHPRIETWRKTLLENGRRCPMFRLEP